MTVSVAKDKSINRRIALRIYDQANLFYVKIDQPHGQESSGFESILGQATRITPPMDESPEHALPVSQSQENDTLDVNISASGIAFTARDELVAGDYLMLRILLLSSMTVVMTCCKVVYCKPSNPYESGHYPYAIGARFVNLSDGDAELLNRYVRRHRKQQLVLNGVIGAVVLAILAAPGEALALMISLAHHLLEIVLHFLHLGFEYLEMGLDHVIEHWLHTELHETQIIVFYVLVTIALIPLYFLGRKVPAACRQISNRLRLFLLRKRSSLQYYWDGQTLLDKVRIVGVSTLLIAGYGYLSL